MNKLLYLLIKDLHWQNQLLEEPLQSLKQKQAMYSQKLSHLSQGINFIPEQAHLKPLLLQELSRFINQQASLELRRLGLHQQKQLLERYLQKKASEQKQEALRKQLCQEDDLMIITKKNNYV